MPWVRLAGFSLTCSSPLILGWSRFGLVATVADTIVVEAPDWLYVPQANPVPEGVIRCSYTPHSQGAPVAVVMEFLAETETGEYSVRPVFPYGKMFFYQNILQVPTYVLFDPASVTLHVFHLEGDTYQLAVANEQNRFWIPAMQLFLGTWSGTRLGTTTHWLRWWDTEGNLLLWSSEKAAQAEQRAEAERQCGERLAAKLRELGINPDEAD